MPSEEYKELDLHYLMYISNWYKILMPTISLYVPWYLPASFRKLLATLKADNNVLLWFALITAMFYFSASESLPKWSRSLTPTWSATISRTREAGRWKVSGRKVLLSLFCFNTWRWLKAPRKWQSGVVFILAKSEQRYWAVLGASSGTSVSGTDSQTRNANNKTWK